VELAGRRRALQLAAAMPEGLPVCVGSWCHIWAPKVAARWVLEKRRKRFCPPVKTIVMLLFSYFCPLPRL
jgi:hypothetical protein